MRISDWSSDVCSSDLPVLPRLPGSQPRAGRAGRWRPFPGAWRIGRLAHACYSPGRGESQMIHLKKEETKAMVAVRSEEHTSELQSLMRISYAVFCLKKKKIHKKQLKNKQKTVSTE